ncbi:MAG TPA: SHOCT domain-containing protein [Coriobacteriia bacterium]|nr:SHOCT domain-containing protein [Coriobacteriia bacterium]
MTAVLLTAVAATAMVVVLARDGVRELSPFRARTPLSAVQHAERILAKRYARGQINAQEYMRTLEVLHR